MSAVEEIKARINIVDVISTYVPLKKAGRTYKGLCPFHSEKTPSFVVFPDQGTWRCFGACATGGDVFTFLQKRENLPFSDVLSQLALKAGVTLESRAGHTSEDESRENRLRQLMADATTYFHRILKTTPAGALAQQYLTERGLSDDTIARFELGYALEQWDAGLKYWRSLGYELSELLTAGLVSEHEGGQQVHDRFRHRLMIPIRDLQGRPVGFGARTLGGGLPKYLNSPATPLFDKGKILFALDLARNAIRRQGEAVIVEGYMDALAAHQAGFENVVAAMGTALSEAQLSQLKRLTNRFILALDADSAGEKATVRGLQVARNALERQNTPVPTPKGLVRMESRLDAEIRILALPPGKDPDDVIRSDPNEWRARVAGAQPLVDYFMDLVARTSDLSSAHGKAEAVETLAPLIAEISSDKLEVRGHYIQRLARLVRANERVIEQRVTEAASRAAQKKPPKPAPPTAIPAPGAPAQTARPVEAERVVALAGPDAKRLGLETRCMSYLISYPGLLLPIQAELGQAQVLALNGSDFEHAEYRALFNLLEDYVTRSDQQALTTIEQEPALSAVVAMLKAALPAQEIQPDERTLKSLVDTILQMRSTTLRMQMQELQGLLEDGTAEQEKETVNQYARLFCSYAMAMEQIDKLLASRRVTNSPRRSL